MIKQITGSSFENNWKAIKKSHFRHPFHPKNDEHNDC